MHKKYANPTVICTLHKALLGSLLSRQIWSQSEWSEQLDCGWTLFFSINWFLPQKTRNSSQIVRVHITKQLYFLSGFLPPVSESRILFRPTSASSLLETLSSQPQWARSISGWKITGDSTKSPEVFKPTPPKHSQSRAGRCISNENPASFFENNWTVNSKAISQLALFPAGKFWLW